jgi:cytochrome c oxidase subunit II
MRKEILMITFLGALLLIYGCGSSETQDGGVESPPETNPLEDDDVPPDEPVSSEVKEFTMTAKQWDFEPSTITVNQGDTVKLSIESVDVAHGFAISAFGVNERLEPGETTNVEFVADESGTFTFFCSVQCGAGHPNMRGQLIVN